LISLKVYPCLNMKAPLEVAKWQKEQPIPKRNLQLYSDPTTTFSVKYSADNCRPTCWSTTTKVVVYNFRFCFFALASFPRRILFLLRENFWKVYVRVLFSSSFVALTGLGGVYTCDFICDSSLQVLFMGLF
jgi:hypothetical protein